MSLFWHNTGKIILHMESKIKRLFVPIMVKIKKTKNKKQSNNARLAAK